MPEYRRAYVPGGTFFFTIVTFERRPIFSIPRNVQLLRSSIAAVRAERTFEVNAGVILPDHTHFLWTMPEGDSDYSWRIGRMKAFFTKSFRAGAAEVGDAHPTGSRLKHREAQVWQRRFWEHVIRDESDFENHLNYIHYNPVKHGLATCPHLWPHSSFEHWVKRDVYEPTWCCACEGKCLRLPYPDEMEETVGE